MFREREIFSGTQRDGWWASGKGSCLKRTEQGSASGMGRMGIREEAEVGAEGREGGITD